MEEQLLAAIEKPIQMRALEALGKGFDLSSDFRLKFAKGMDGNGDGRLVVLDEVKKRDILIPGTGGGFTIPGVSEDIRCDKGDRIRFKSDVLEFNQVREKFLFFSICVFYPFLSFMCFFMYLGRIF